MTTVSEIPDQPSLDRARALDAADPLATHRSRFLGADTPLVYFDGNSLGRPLAATAGRLAGFVEGEWGGRLIRGWDERWFDLPLTLGDRLGAACLGAAPGQTLIGDSTTVLLYKLARAAVAARPDRDEIVVDDDNFPTDRYIVEGVARETGRTVRWVRVDPSVGVTPELLREAVGKRTALVVCSHVAYRSGYLADAAELTRITHDAGGLILLDLSHSGGSVPIELDGWDVDLAVGCTYKYLNGGPGSPAYAYVARHHQATLSQPIQGWMGHALPFVMGPGYTPSAGMRRFLSGTPAIVGMQPVADMLALLEEVGMVAVRAKSIALTGFAVELADAWLTAYGAQLASPRDPDRRGGHITVHHPRMREVTAELWRRDVIPDYREAGGLRIGLSPLSTSFVEVATGLHAVRQTLAALVSPDSSAV